MILLTVIIRVVLAAQLLLAAPVSAFESPAPAECPMSAFRNLAASHHKGTAQNGLANQNKPRGCCCNKFSDCRLDPETVTEREPAALLSQPRPLQQAAGFILFTPIANTSRETGAPEPKAALGRTGGLYLLTLRLLI